MRVTWYWKIHRFNVLFEFCSFEVTTLLVPIFTACNGAVVFKCFAAAQKWSQARERARFKFPTSRYLPMISL